MVGMFIFLLSRVVVAIIVAVAFVVIVNIRVIVFLLGNIVLLVSWLWVFMRSIPTGIFVQMIVVAVVRSFTGAVFVVAVAIFLISLPLRVFHNAHADVSVVILILHQNWLLLCRRQFLEKLICNLVKKEIKEELTRAAIAMRNVINFRFFMIELHVGRETDNICRSQLA